MSKDDSKVFVQFDMIGIDPNVHGAGKFSPYRQKLVDEWIEIWMKPEPVEKASSE